MRVLIQSTRTHVRLTQTSNKSWLLAPPYANIVAIVYQVNDGDKTVLDLRFAITDGIHIQAGDRLRIWEIWYKTIEDVSSKTIFAESYITSGGYNSKTHVQTDEQVFRAGVHELLEGKPFEWTIEPDKIYVIITLARNDENSRSIVLDRYVIPFK